jgi:hypothetical protein
MTTGIWMRLANMRTSSSRCCSMCVIRSYQTETASIPRLPAIDGSAAKTAQEGTRLAAGDFLSEPPVFPSSALWLRLAQSSGGRRNGQNPSSGGAAPD